MTLAVLYPPGCVGPPGVCVGVYESPPIGTQVASDF